MSEDADLQLSELYSDEWLARLLRLCGPGPHAHGGRGCGSLGKRPVESGWIGAADQRSQSPSSLAAHVADMHRHVEELGNEISDRIVNATR